MVKLATRDELTSLSNRRGFMGLAQHSLDLCTRYEMPATLVFIDLCKFKDINDAHGHQEGDLALAAFAEILGGSSRRADIIARLGGDEFVALLPNATMQTTEGYIARLGETLDRYNRDAKRGYEIQFTHGIVAFRAECHETIDDLLAEGDALMYEEKQPDEAERA